MTTAESTFALVARFEKAGSIGGCDVSRVRDGKITEKPSCTA